VDTERLRLAEEFLREAVFGSREKQAAGSLERTFRNETSSCGLGERAATLLDLSPRGRELYEQMFGRAAGPAGDAIRATMTAWIERQDAIDRKRNHFLKAFRGRHGFDRARYAPEVLRDWEAGLAGINAEEDVERRATAGRLLEIES
jgi:hypothetical protein